MSYPQGRDEDTEEEDLLLAPPISPIFKLASTHLPEPVTQLISFEGGENAEGEEL